MLENIFLISLTLSLPIALLLYAVPHLRRRYSAKWGYLAWLVIAIRLLIPFRFEMPQAPVKLPKVPEYNINMGAPQVQQDVQSEPAAPKAPLTPKASAEPQHTASMSVSLSGIIRAVWLTGASIFLLYHICSYLIFKKRVMASASKKDSFRHIPIYECSELSSPVMIGIIKPKIFLPDVKYTPEERQLILAHELTHFKRKDLIYKLIMLAANAVHWFNPLVYLMVRSAACELEYACDDDVIKGSGIDFRKDYSLTILKTTKKENNS